MMKKALFVFGSILPFIAWIVGVVGMQVLREVYLQDAKTWSDEEMVEKMTPFLRAITHLMWGLIAFSILYLVSWAFYDKSIRHFEFTPLFARVVSSLYVLAAVFYLFGGWINVVIGLIVIIRIFWARSSYFAL